MRHAGQSRLATLTPVLGRFVVLCAIVACSACSTLSLDAARTLGATGKEAASKIQGATFASGSEYSRAMDAEALFHGITGTVDSPAYKLIQEKYAKVRGELSKRAVVLAALTDFYEAFGDLAAYDAQGETQAALQSLGGAIDSYRSSVLGAGPLAPSTVGIVTSVGGILASEIQKKAVKEASAAVRPQLEAFRAALGDKLVKEQFVGFRRLLAQDRKAAIALLWDAGVFDPEPLITGIGSDAGLSAGREASRIVLKDKSLRNGLGEVVERRLALNIDALDESYDASLKLIARLIVEHQKLEDGAPLDIARLRELVAQLQGIVNLLAKK